MSNRQRLTQNEVLTIGWPEWCYWPRSPFERYAINFCNRNQWRVTYVLGSFSDCLQTAAEDWVYCRNRYAVSVNNPAWFMSLYKLTLASTFNTLSTKDHQMRNVELDSCDNEVEYQEGPALCALQQASAELKVVLAMLANAPAEMLDMLLDTKSEAAQNRRLLRFAKQPVTHNVLAELKVLLTGNCEQGAELRTASQQLRQASAELRAQAQELKRETVDLRHQYTTLISP